MEAAAGNSCPPDLNATGLLIPAQTPLAQKRYPESPLSLLKKS